MLSISLLVSFFYPRLCHLTPTQPFPNHQTIQQHHGTTHPTYSNSNILHLQRRTRGEAQAGGFGAVDSPSHSILDISPNPADTTGNEIQNEKVFAIHCQGGGVA